MEKPLVSVLISCYNYGEYVGQAVESILNQTYDNIELIVVDNGSTDNSYEVLKSFGDRIHKLMHLDENDLSRAGSLLRENATGEYVAFMTADDYWHPQKLHKQMKVFEQYPSVRACFTWVHTIDEAGIIISDDECPNKFEYRNRSRYEWMEQFIMQGNLFSYPSTVVNKECYFELFTKRYYQLGDKYLWMNFILNYDLFVVEEKLTYMRWHPKSKTPNVSSVTSESVARTYTEMALIVEDIFEKMEDDFFVNTFRKYLRNPNAVTHEEILCEKLFVLMYLAEKNPVYEQTVVSFFYEHDKIVKNEFVFENALNDYYGYSNMDFQDYCSKHGIGYRMMQLNEMEKERQRSIVQRLYYDELRNIVREDEGINNKIEQYRRHIYLRFDDDTKELLYGVYKYLDDVLRVIEESDDNILRMSMPNIIASVCGIYDILQQIWDKILKYDLIDNIEWDTTIIMLKNEEVDMEIFCDKILPFLVELYTVLKQYTC